MNIGQAFNAMQNPQGYVMQQVVQSMIRENPTQWQKAKELIDGKSYKQSVSELRKLYKSQGMDLDNIAKQWGIKI